MKILLIGIGRLPHLGPTFRRALEELGHSIELVDESCAYTIFDRRPIRRFARNLIGERPSGWAILRRRLLRSCIDFRPDLILAIKGGSIDSEILHSIRETTAAPLVMFSTDNPFNANVSSSGYVEALRYWDVIATPRRRNIAQLGAYCRGDIFYLPFGYDPVLHYPDLGRDEQERRRYSSEILFIGGCDADRVPYLEPLACLREVNVQFYGGYYKYTPALRRRDRGYAKGRSYRIALSLAKVSVCLVRRANDDDHVMRTFETPACGAFMLAERTPDHCEIFEEGKEAVFFSTPEELVDKAHYYLANAEARQRIARAGYLRIIENRNTYRDRLHDLLKRVTRK